MSVIKIRNSIKSIKNLFEGSNQTENNKHMHFTYSVYVLYVLSTGTVCLSSHWLCTNHTLTFFRCCLVIFFQHTKDVTKGVGGSNPAPSHSPSLCPWSRSDDTRASLACSELWVSAQWWSEEPLQLDEWVTSQQCAHNAVFQLKHNPIKCLFTGNPERPLAKPVFGASWPDVSLMHTSPKQHKQLRPKPQKNSRRRAKQRQILLSVRFRSLHSKPSHMFSVTWASDITCLAFTLNHSHLWTTPKGPEWQAAWRSYILHVMLPRNFIAK